MTRRPIHDESTAEISAPTARVFAALDSHARLTSHMGQPSWRMGWSRMTTEVDEGRGERVGSHIRMAGRVFGLKVWLDEVVVEREPPTRKVWETVGTPRLFVIGSYRMGFEVTPLGAGCRLRVFIDYAQPTSWPSRWLARLFGRYYARWCTRAMTTDAMERFSVRAPAA